MKQFSVVLSFSLISILGFPQWKWQNPSPAGNPLYAVFFTDPAHGYAAGDAGTILKTTDRGSTWTVRPGGQDVTCFSIFFTNENTGYVAGMKRRGGSVILKTTDAGNSWNTVASDTASGLYSIYFPGSNIGYSAGLGGGMLKTTDGGDTWTHQNIAPHANIMSLYFTDDNTGYAAGYDDIDFTGILLKTINGGVNWDTLLYFPHFTSLTSVVFTDANTGYAVTATTGISSPEPSVKILKTENGGSSWSVLSGGATLSSCLHTVFFPDDSTGYAGGDPGLLMKTT